MRILQIAFKNINSLVGEHEIDFTQEPFTYSSLFAITGPTGSGKSTILDVVSLALFGTTPRMGRISKGDVSSMGAILTRGQKEAYAKVTYACKNGTFRSEWHISTARTGNLRDYEMRLFNMQTDKALDYKKSQIPGANEKYIGLDYNQFNKSVVLAQGEFAEFLKANKADRGALLEKITGADIYRKIGKAVYDRNKANEESTKEIVLVVNNKKEERYPEEKLKSLEKETQELNGQLDIIGKQLSDLKEKDKRIKEIQAKQADLDKTIKSFETSTAALNLFMEQNGSSWELHKKLRPYLTEIQHWEQIKKDIQRLEIQQQNLKASKAQLNNSNLGIYQEIARITKTEVHNENAITELDTFYKHYEAVKNKREEFITKYRERGLVAEGILKTLKLENSLKISSPKLEGEVLKTKASTQDIYSSLLAQLQQTTEGITEEVLESEEQKLQQLRRAQLLGSEIKSLAKNKEESEERIANSTKSLEQLTNQTELLETKAKLCNKEYEALEKDMQLARLAQSLEEHRHHLKDGEACPLCGSLEHPFASKDPAPTSDMELAIAKAKQAFENANKLYLKNISDVQSLSKILEKEQESFKVLNSDLDKQLENFQKNFKEISNPVSFDFKEAITKQENQYRIFQKTLKTKHDLESLNQLEPIAKEIVRLIEQGKEARNELDALYAAGDFKEKYTELRDAINKNKTTLESLIQQEKVTSKEYSDTDSKLKNIEPSLTASLQEAGFESIEYAIAHRLKDNEFLEFDTKHQKITHDIKIAETQKDLHLVDLKKLKNGVSLEEQETIVLALEEKQKIQQGLVKQKEEVDYQLRYQNKLGQEIEALETQINKLTEDSKQWAILNKLIGDAKGNRFNNYAQDLSLTHLLQLANKRLDELQSRYNIDKALEDEGDNLMVVDRDMGNQRRAISTLSGGETFMVSLSLALALSDLASKNIQIESMFIDEGFGTLDPESLDQTLDSLERLQMESSKIIGVISHVDSLKERIATQIQLTQDGKGYSKMNVVG